MSGHDDADGPLDETDLRLLADLADLWSVADPVPADLALEIRFQLGVRALHAEVAELQRNGDPPAAAEPVGAGAFRDDDAVLTDTLTFSCDRLSAMVTVTGPDPATGNVRIDGWVTIPQCRIELRQISPERRGTTTVRRLRADADGRFTLDDVARGPAQLLFDHPERTVLTPWVDL